MAKIIIGIHGLANKVYPHMLKAWWQLCLLSGFKNAGLEPLPFRFELLYWADLFYPQPQDPLIDDPEHPLYVPQPFKRIRARTVPPDLRRKEILDHLEQTFDKLLRREKIFKGLSELGEKFIEKRFNELYRYLNGKTGYGDALHRPVREVIAERFRETLLRHRKDSICLIAHSMGSIIAYDMLYHYDDLPEIDLLLTIGSPIAQPLLMAKLTHHNPIFSKIQTPESVNRWVNLADLYDLVAINYSLSDDYAPNSKGVNPVDLLVHNDYQWEGEPNPHSSYGYLQTPECGRLVYEFLTQGKSLFVVRLQQRAFYWRERLFHTTEKLAALAPTRQEKTGRSLSPPADVEGQISRQAGS